MRLLAGLLAVVVAGPVLGQERSDPLLEPVMVPVQTGSRLATWTLPGTGQARRTPIIYLHGGPGGFISPSNIDKGAPLRSAGFTTIYFDQAGNGRSARIPASQYTLERAVNDLEALRVALKLERVILWGSSYGADLAVLYQQRLPARVAGIIFTSPASFPGSRPKYDYHPTDDRNIAPGAALLAAARLIDSRGGGAETRLSQEDAGKLFDAEINSRSLDGRMVCKGDTAPTPAVAQGGNLYANRMLLKELANLKLAIAPPPPLPALTIRGACDFIPVDNARKYQSVYGGALVTIESDGHGLRENPEALRQALARFAAGPLAVVD